MLTYSSQASQLAKPTEKPWVLLLLCFIWLWPGILGHDPWKPDEPFVLAVAQSMLHSGNWLLPTLQGAPYLDNPPLYYWLAAGCIKLFSPWLLPAHDAARMATPMLMALSLLLAGMAGRELIGRRHGRSVVMILIGCIGLVEAGHQLTPTVASFAGFAAAFYALTLTLRSPGLAGALLGAASVATFLGGSLMDLLLIWLAALMLPAFSGWRSKNYALTLLLALLVAVPAILVWPMLLARDYPAVYADWWANYALGQTSGFHRLRLFHDFGYYSLNALWFAFPAWPLALWTLYRNRELQTPKLQLPLVFSLMIALFLTLSDRASITDAMPLLLPLSILAAVELDNLRRGAAAFLNWFALMTFGLFGLLVWLGWAAMNYGWPQGLAGRAQYFSPFYQPHVSWWQASGALVATLAWLWALSRRNLRGRQAVTNWAAGLTLLWGLGLTLWLPWFDAAKSYRPVVVNMQRKLPAEASCIATESRNKLALISWRYYAGIELLPFPAGETAPCDYWLVVRNSEEGVAEPGWQVLWTGHRPREQNMTFALLQRLPPAKPAE
ncbi:ArnT family glycosyltransferase [Chromobacterium sp. CV08]|uniref:ArnT family glycosyltransferase n=1 Tax=Chromobacterium sp. CV08 TaxID=3133274 RepID=UPI003DA98000